jgi:hypothetical protein
LKVTRAFSAAFHGKQIDILRGGVDYCCRNPGRLLISSRCAYTRQRRSPRPVGSETRCGPGFIHAIRKITGMFAEGATMNLFFHYMPKEISIASGLLTNPVR